MVWSRRRRLGGHCGVVPRCVAAVHSLLDQGPLRRGDAAATQITPTFTEDLATADAKIEGLFHVVDPSRPLADRHLDPVVARGQWERRDVALELAAPFQSREGGGRQRRSNSQQTLAEGVIDPDQ